MAQRIERETIEKKCKKCGLIKTADHFHIANKHRKGSSRYYAECIICRNEKRYERSNRTKRAGFLYIITSEGHPDYYKIGVSDRPFERLKDMQTGNPFILQIIHLIETDDMYRLETYIHRVLKQYQFREEWYKLPDKLNILYGFTAIKGMFGFVTFTNMLGIISDKEYEKIIQNRVS